MKRIGVIGGGAWGTALAAVAARAGRSVTLWAREPDVPTAINDHHENRRFLPGVPLDPAIRATDDLSEAADADLLLLVTPAQNLAAIVEELTQATDRMPPCVVCAKGIERQTGALMSDAVGRVAPSLPLAALSGPTFAREVAQGLPAAVSLACEDARLGQAAVEALGGPAFRPYLTDDLIGVQIGGAVKNVIANRRRHHHWPRPRRQRPRRRHRARLRRAHAACRRQGRACGDPRRPLGPGRPRADLRQRRVAQLQFRPRTRRRRGAGLGARRTRGRNRGREQRAGGDDPGRRPRGGDAHRRRGSCRASSGRFDRGRGRRPARPPL